MWALGVQVLGVGGGAATGEEPHPAPPPSSVLLGLWGLAPHWRRVLPQDPDRGI